MADTIITLGGVQSNHCRTTAQLCARLGLHCHLILRGNAPAASPDGNLLLDQLFGAEVSYHRAATFSANEPETISQCCEHYRQRGRKPFVIPIGASDEVGLWGYLAAVEELLADYVSAGIQPRHVICATGSGGTQGGLTLGMHLMQADTSVWGINVCDDAEYFYRKIHADVTAWSKRYQQPDVAGELAINTIEGYVGPGYARATPDIFATIRQLASTEGIVLDPVYTGKAFHGLCEEVKAGRFADSEDIVFIHTGGIFGLFPQRDQLLA
jgi:D-cysteine desulfhydrase